MNNAKYTRLNIVALIMVISLSCAKETPNDKHALSSRKFQGIPSMAITPEGRLWATWYAGITPGEDENNYVVVATSGDGGKSWIEKLIIDPDGNGHVRAFDPELWIDPEGKLWVFWAETIGHDGTSAKLWAKTNDKPGKEDSKWSKPRQITDGVMMCKPTVLSTGEWAFPVSTWRETDNSARVIVSKDKGKTFNIRGTCNVPKEVRDYDEHMIIERKDKSLWMLIRTKYGIGESISTDRGKTWSVPVPASIRHPSARFFVRRLSSENLLLVKHGPINERTGRSHLTAYLSEDDGYTWLGGLLLDERTGVSYPDGQQSSDGTIYIIYDYSRTTAREIIMTTFTEADVIEGDTASASVSSGIIISKYTDMEDYKKIFIHEAIVNIISQEKTNEIRYTTDGTEASHNSLLYTGPFKVSNTTHLKIKEYSSDGSIRSEYEAHYIKEEPIKPSSVISKTSGLNFEYFELPGSIESVVDLQKYDPKITGKVDSFTFPYNAEKLTEYFGLKLLGYINIPKENVYSFSVVSNDGSSLFIDDKLVVDNDGPHSAYEKKGEIALQKGLHKIKLSYFQAGGGKYLKVYWKSRDIKRSEIPGSILSY